MLAALPALASFALMMAMPGAAHAQDLEAARQRLFNEQYARASTAYNSKDYAAAIPALQQSFALQPLPQILFNLAQAYRHLDQWSSARVYFELYRSMAMDLTPERSEAVDRLILQVKEQEQATQTPQVIEKTRLVYIQSERRLPTWLRPAGITAGVAGLGLLITGGVFLGLDGRCASEPVPPAQECTQLFGTKTLGTALTVIGAGTFVFGAVTFGLSRRRPSRPIVRESPSEDSTPLMPSLPPAMQTPAAEPPPSGFNPDGSRLHVE